MLLGVVHRIRQHVSNGRYIAAEIVGHYTSGLALLTAENLAEETFGSFPVTAILDENIEHITVLIHCTPEVALLAVNRDEDLVAKPIIPKPTFAALQRSLIPGSKL